MARRKPGMIAEWHTVTDLSSEVPVVVGTGPQPNTADGVIQSRVMGGPDVTLFSRKPNISVTVRLRGPVTPPVPRPKVSVVDLPGRVGLTQWDGRDPYEVTIPLIFDGIGRGGNVEDDIALLEALALRHKGDDAPPVVRTTGPVPQPADMNDPQWRIAGFTPAEGDRGYFTEYNGAGHRIRYPIDVQLIERVVDTTLAGSIDRTAAAAGIANRKTKVRKGETNLHQVAKRVYGDRGKAQEIAVANGIVNLGLHLTAGTTLRLPS